MSSYVTSTVSPGSLLVAKEPICWWWDKDADLETDSYCTCSERPSAGSWAGSEALGEVRNNLVDVFL